MEKKTEIDTTWNYKGWQWPHHIDALLATIKNLDVNEDAEGNQQMVLHRWWYYPNFILNILLPCYVKIHRDVQKWNQRHHYEAIIQVSLMSMWPLQLHESPFWEVSHSCFADSILKFLIFKWGGLHFYFSLGSQISSQYWLL